MEPLKRVLSFIDSLNERVAKFASWALIFLVLTMTYEVIARYVFGRPTLWSYDVSYMLSSFTLVLGMGYVLHIKEHVNVEFIYNKLSERGQALLDIIFFLLLFAPLWIYLLTFIYPNVARSWAINERAAAGTWRPIIYPYKSWIFLGVILLSLQGVAEFIRDVVVLITGGERP